MLVEFLIFAVALIAINSILQQRRSKNLPPGPLQLPLLGNVLQLGRTPYIRLNQWAKSYGRIYSLRFGPMRAVVLNDYEDIKEMFADPRCVGRMPANPVIQEFAKGNNGIAVAEGEVWVAQRRFALRTLHQLGMSKVSMEGMILDEAHALVTWFDGQCGKPVSGNRLFNMAVVNSIWRIISGKRCNWEHGKTKEITVIDEFMSATDVITSNGVFFAPILKDIAPGFFQWNRFSKSVQETLKLFTETINEHKATFDPNNFRDYIDIYLNEIKKEVNPQSSFYKDNAEAQLTAQVFDLFFAGSETTSSLLSWAMLYLGTHPNVLDKLQKEVDLVVGKRTPFLSDRTKMPYTQAVLNELLRIAPILPFGIPHRLLEDMNFLDYDLPKGTHILSDLYTPMHNPDIWEEPFSFKPERFLTEDGTKLIRYPALIPFSDGRRKCPGEGVARDTAFIFLVSIFQRFNLNLEEKFLKNPNFEPSLGYITRPQQFNVTFHKRNSFYNLQIN